MKIVKTKELSIDMRKFVNATKLLIIECHKEGKCYQKIPKDLNLLMGTVGAIVLKWKKCHTLKTSKVGCARKLNETSARLVAQKVKKILFLHVVIFRRI